MSSDHPADERAMLLAAASAVAGSGLLIWSLSAFARPRARAGAAMIAGLGGAALLAHGVFGENLLAWLGERMTTSAGDVEPIDVADDDPVDLASMDSFPASDPPSTSGATAQVTRRGLIRARDGLG